MYRDSRDPRRSALRTLSPRRYRTHAADLRAVEIWEPSSEQYRPNGSELQALADIWLGARREVCFSSPSGHPSNACELVHMLS